MLLASIAMEEMSLSKLMDAESEKIKYVVNQQKCCCNDIEINNLVAINNSVSSTMNGMVNMQMLLKSKLENVQKLLPKEKPHPPCRNCCKLVGTGIGVYCEGYIKVKAVLEACVCTNSEISNNHLHYQVSNNHASICMNACPDMCLICPKECDKRRVVLTGKCCVIQTRRGIETCINAEFKLTFVDSLEKRGYQIIIQSDDCHDFYHNSRFIPISNCEDRLRIELC